MRSPSLFFAVLFASGLTLTQVYAAPPEEPMDPCKGLPAEERILCKITALKQGTKPKKPPSVIVPTARVKPNFDAIPGYEFKAIEKYAVEKEL